MRNWGRSTGARIARGALIPLSLVIACPVYADVTRDPSAAEALFLAGRALMEKGDYVAACPKFAESDRLDPAPGTLINLADCEEHLTKLALAWEHWKEAIELLPADDARLPIIKQRAGAVEKRVPRLTLKLAPGTPADVRIVRDDVDVGIGALSVPLPEDPGEHVVVVSAAGHKPRRFTVSLQEGQAQELVVEPGEAEVVANAAGEKPPASPPGLWMRPTGFVVGGVGVIALGVSAVTGVVAIGKKKDEASQCYPAKVCTQAGADAASSGRTLATVSTVGFFAGIAAVGGGVALILLSPKQQPSTGRATTVLPAVFAGGAGVFVTRAF